MKRQPSRQSTRKVTPSSILRSDSMMSTSFMPRIHKNLSVNSFGDVDNILTPVPAKKAQLT